MGHSLPLAIKLSSQLQIDIVAVVPRSHGHACTVQPGQLCEENLRDCEKGFRISHGSATHQSCGLEQTLQTLTLFPCLLGIRTELPCQVCTVPHTHRVILVSVFSVVFNTLHGLRQACILEWIKNHLH